MIFGVDFYEQTLNDPQGRRVYSKLLWCCTDKLSHAFWPSLPARLACERRPLSGCWRTLFNGPLLPVKSQLQFSVCFSSSCRVCFPGYECTRTMSVFEPCRCFSSLARQIKQKLINTSYLSVYIHQDINEHNFAS